MVAEFSTRRYFNAFSTASDDLGADGEQNTQVVTRESVLLRTIESEHANGAIQAFERYCQRGPQRAEFTRIAHVAGFYRWIAIENGLAILSHPSGETFAHGDFEGREQAEVLTVHVLRHQFLVAHHIDGDGVVWHQALQADRNHGKSLVQAE